MVNEQRLIELFKQLCLINAPSLAEQDSVKYVRELLENLGLEVKEDNAGARIGSKANNLIATLKGNKTGLPRIFFSAHFDTVEPTEGLVIAEREGVFYSDSDTILGADDKGGMAPIIEAVACLVESGTEHGDIVLLFSVAEEIGLLGAGALDIQDLNLDFGFVLDTGPPVGSFVTRTATHDRINFFVHGKPAHSGKDPEKGINAICVAADAISQIKVGRLGPETTSNLGIISGGTGVNIVCPSVRIQGEARSTSVEELDKAIDDMRRAFESAAEKWGTTVEIEHDRHYGSYTLAPESQVVSIAQSAATKLGMSGELRTTLGGSDANQYNSKGVPTIVVATGMDKIHTHQECISRQSLIDTTRLVLQIVSEVAGG